MRLATVWWCRLTAAFVVGLVLGYVLATLDLRSSTAWLHAALEGRGFSHYDYEYEYEWSTLAGTELPELLPATVVPSTRKPICNRTVAEGFQRRVRVLCWVMTGPQNHATKAAAVNNTWGRHCNVLLFMTSKHDPRLPTVALNVSEGRENLWLKTQAAFKHILHEGYLKDIDWVLKADDDTFVVMENLRQMLQPLNASHAMFMGLRLRRFSPRGFMSGGAGYVLSRTAVRRLVEVGLGGKLLGCHNPGYLGEDVAIGRCMLTVNAMFVDSRDSHGLQRFHAYPPERQMAPDKQMDWLKNYSYHKLQPPSRCCSPDAITFHYVSPTAMKAMYYLIYRLKPYGLDECELPAS